MIGYSKVVIIKSWIDIQVNRNIDIKGFLVFHKPSGKLIVVPNLCVLFELETSNFGYLLIFNFATLKQ